MEITEYKNIYNNERTHFFYVTTNILILSLVSKYTSGKKLKILDAGCGTGLLAKQLQAFGEITAVDFSSEAIKFAKKRGIKATQASILDLPFRKNNFDVLVSVDVITHKSIKNDLTCLNEFYRVLKPGGILILRVSANNWLNMIHDKHVHMNHRYNRGELFDKLNKSNFNVLKLSFVNSILLPALIFRFLIEKITKPKGSKSAINTVNGRVNNLLTKILKYEYKLIMRYNIPFGIGLVAVARKPLKENLAIHTP